MGDVDLLGFTDNAEIIGDNPHTAVIDPALKYNKNVIIVSLHLYIYILFSKFSICLQFIITNNIKLDAVAKQYVMGISKGPIMDHQMIGDVKFLFLQQLEIRVELYKHEINKLK